jgi:hypothetical protein
MNLANLLRLASFAASWLSGVWVHSVDGMGANTVQNGGDPYAFAVFVTLWAGSWYLIWWSEL